MTITARCNKFVDSLNNAYEGSIPSEELDMAFDDCYQRIQQEAHDEWWTAVSPEEHGLEFSDYQPTVSVPLRKAA